MTPPLRFYFDYISSNAYLAWVELPRLEREYGVAIEPIPTLFAGLLEAHGQLGPAEIPAKIAWMWRNNLRKAAILGVPLNPPAYHPFRPLASLRATATPAAASRQSELIGALFRAVWVDGRHVSELEVVGEIAGEVGLDAAAVVEQAASDEAKARLRADTSAAIEAGVFGVPTMCVGDELFWGFDDLPYLERFLAGEDTLDPEAVPKWEKRPRASSQRRRFRGSESP